MSGATSLRAAWRALRRHVARPCRDWLALASARRAWMRDKESTDAEIAMLRRVSLRLHPDDGMYVTTPRHYLGVGLSALRCIDRALAARPDATPTPIRAVLDFPCGHGRVLRFLRVRFPDARLAAVEIDATALDFCARALGASAFRSDSEFGGLDHLGQFDLIWCGSLLTHLDEAGSARLLRVFDAHLAPGGLCVVTTHGRAMIDRLASGRETYALGPDARQTLLRDYHASGHGYANYEGHAGYGVSATTHERMLALADSIGWRQIVYLEQGWDDHQDVHGFMRRGRETTHGE